MCNYPRCSEATQSGFKACDYHRELARLKKRKKMDEGMQQGAEGDEEKTEPKAKTTRKKKARLEEKTETQAKARKNKRSKTRLEGADSKGEVGAPALALAKEHEKEEVEQLTGAKKKKKKKRRPPPTEGIQAAGAGEEKRKKLNTLLGANDKGGVATEPALALGEGEEAAVEQPTRNGNKKAQKRKTVSSGEVQSEEREEEQEAEANVKDEGTGIRKSPRLSRSREEKLEEPAQELTAEEQEHSSRSEEFRFLAQAEPNGHWTKYYVPGLDKNTASPSQVSDTGWYEYSCLEKKNGKGKWKIHRGQFCVLKDGSEVLVYAVALAAHPRLERFIMAWNNDNQLQAVPVKDVCSCRSSCPRRG